MTTTTWTFVPAGMLGQGNADVRPYAGVVVCPTVEPVRGTGLPIGDSAAEARGMTRDRVARLRSLTSAAVLKSAHAPAAQKFSADIFAAQQSTQNDGTTLGIHTPGRPQS